MGQAATLDYKAFIRVLDYWEQHAGPDGTDDDAAAKLAKRSFRLSESFTGMWLGDLVLDPISGAIVSGQLRRIEDELFAAEWKEAKERLGEDATITGADLARTPTQRRADALVEMATRAGVAPENGRRPEPLFSVFVGYETFAGRMCQMADGAVVSPGAGPGPGHPADHHPRQDRFLLAQLHHQRESVSVRPLPQRAHLVREHRRRVFFFVVRPVNALMARRKTTPDVESTTKTCEHCLSSIPRAASACAFCTRDVQAG